MPANSNLSGTVLKKVVKAEDKAEDKTKEIQTEIVQKRPIDYVWTVFIFLAFAIIGFWYILIYSARQQQRDSSRFHFSRFGFSNQKEVEEAFTAYDWPKITSFWIPFASAKVHQIYYQEGMAILQPFFASYSTENSTLRDAKAKKNAENFIKGVYLTLSSIICLHFMNQSNYLPVIMGGISSSNSILNIHANYPLLAHTYGLKRLYLVLSGYHLSGTIRHLKIPVEKQRNDHIEMCLHHLLTLSLFYGAYVMNDIESGIIVSYLMDFCDIWTHFAKAFVDTKFKNTCTTFGVLMWFFWGYTRLFCFPYHVYMSYFISPFSDPMNMSGSYEGYNYRFTSSLLTILGIMGVWWWYLITKMVWRSITKGQNKDIQNKIE